MTLLTVNRRRMQISALSNRPPTIIDIHSVPHSPGGCQLAIPDDTIPDLRQPPV